MINNISIEIRNDLICSSKGIKKYSNLFIKISKVLLMIDNNEKTILEAALGDWLNISKKNTDLQNIDLMNLAGFCQTSVKVDG